jgi:hypothetical protein
MYGHASNLANPTIRRHCPSDLTEYEWQRVEALLGEDAAAALDLTCALLTMGSVLSRKRGVDVHALLQAWHDPPERTYSKLARTLGVDSSTVDSWAKFPEHHKHRGVSPRWQAALCAALGVDLIQQALAAPEPPAPPKPPPPEPAKVPAFTSPVAVARPRPSPIVSAGVCADGDECPRWHCTGCGAYWLGKRADHRCGDQQRLHAWGSTQRAGAA